VLTRQEIEIYGKHEKSVTVMFLTLSSIQIKICIQVFEEIKHFISALQKQDLTSKFYGKHE
jgi:hypothetical protein